MKKFSAPFTALFALLTLGASLLVTYLAEGQVYAVVPSAKLLHYGAVDGDVWKTNEFWRVVTSQFIHQQTTHMIFYVLMVWTIGSALEIALGSIPLFVIYWVGGCAGVYADLLASPHLVSFGAAPALMALSGAVLVASRKVLTISKGTILSAVSVIALQAILDLKFHHFPNTGHLCSLIAGGILALLLVGRKAPLA